MDHVVRVKMRNHLQSYLDQRTNESQVGVTGVGQEKDVV